MIEETRVETHMRNLRDHIQTINSLSKQFDDVEFHQKFQDAMGYIYKELAYLDGLAEGLKQ